MLNLVLFGPPGAGKGTQAEMLVDKYNLVHISTGDILRHQIRIESPLGNEAKKYIDKGKLVPDELVIRMINSKIERNSDAKGFIFDGFPRTIKQAEALDKLLEEKETSILLMLSLEVEKEELVKRLLLRGENSGRSDDQDISIIGKRISVYHNETAPVIGFYKAQNKHKGINGIGTVKEIFEKLCEAIDSINK